MKSVARRLRCSLSDDVIAQFHIFGLLIVVVMSGSVAFESLVLGEISSAKIGYMQIQSGLANAAIAITALLVIVLGWGALRSGSHRFDHADIFLRCQG